MEEKKVLLSIKDLEVKFRVRGRILTAIRNVSLDIYENESIAIVGESGSGKSVFTKTFAGMLDSNGFISNGRIIFNDEELVRQVEPITPDTQKLMDESIERLNANATLQC
ncbi:MAG: ATP-binding cassette domain-containing protein, partial [Lachnospiraceae bacterium]|nr:ATP-binding cassette domain-containing protein [Lachnospiraceae bacterium]